MLRSVFRRRCSTATDSSRLLGVTLKRYRDCVGFLPASSLEQLTTGFLSASTTERDDYVREIVRDIGTDDAEVTAAVGVLQQRLAAGQEATAAREAVVAACRGPVQAWASRIFADLGTEGLDMVLDLRRHVLGMIPRCLGAGDAREAAGLRALSASLGASLSGWFNAGILDLVRVTFDSPGALLEAVRDAERVHPYSGLRDFKRRVGPGRRCFALVHPRAPSRPLAVLHTALTPAIAPSLAYINDHTGGKAAEAQARCAMFYSISNAEPALRGVELGRPLIKRAVRWLQLHDPHIDTFCTLSPVPGFAAWADQRLAPAPPADPEPSATTGRAFTLSSQHEAALVGAVAASDPGFAQGDDPAAAALAWVFARRTSGQPVSAAADEASVPAINSLTRAFLSRSRQSGLGSACPVANFHLRNGAVLERVNALGNTTPAGLRSSHGVMVNYLYSISELERNGQAYDALGAGVIAAE